MHKLLFLLLVVGCSGCPSAPLPPATSGPVIPLPPEGPATCASACERLKQLRCPAASQTAEGAACEEVCLNVMDSGVISWNLDCRIKATSCAAVDACEADPSSSLQPSLNHLVRMQATVAELLRAVDTQK